MGDNELSDRLFRFGVDVIIAVRNLKGGAELLIIRPQLIKAATSSGANYEEAQGAVSRPDFGNKVGISLKEMRESNYWLRVFNYLYPDDHELERLKNENYELKHILGSISTKVTKK